MKATIAWLGAVAGGLLFASASANAFTCDDVDVDVTVTRTWSLDPANDCKTGGGNPKDTDINAQYGPSWTKLGDIAVGGDNSDYLDVQLLSGSWGGTKASGTWTLTSAFWAKYGEAVITIHVGGQPGDTLDDYAAFYIFPLGSKAGTWSYEQNPLTGAGGGLSNLGIFGRGPALCPPGSTDPRCIEKEVPEPGTLALLGLGLLGLGLSRKTSKLR